DDRRLALLCGVGLVAALIAGYLTYSRAFWLAITCGLVVAIAVHSARAAQFGRRALVALVLVCAIGLALAAIVAAEQGRELTKMEDRWPIYSAVLKKLPENPLTGTGFGHETDKPWYERALPGMGVFHPHNVVLSYLDQMGPAGLAALALLFAAPAFAFGATLRRGPATTAMPALCGLVLLTCVFVKNNLDHFFVKPGLWLFFAHLGLYLGQIERETRAAAQTASTLRRCAASLVT
ncbi:MAG TPA: O-antigen ligase family protein, partial [Burkholderiales bacterium]|nr:O-antigen ligase family protein [Burkholderiales bacterium]